jgi:heme exporter protein D
MYFSSAVDLITMSGHGFYVWLAFGFSVFCLVYLLVNPLRKKNQLLQTIFLQQVIEENRKVARK